MEKITEKIAEESMETLEICDLCQKSILGDIFHCKAEKYKITQLFRHKKLCGKCKYVKKCGCGQLKENKCKNCHNMVEDSSVCNMCTWDKECNVCYDDEMMTRESFDVDSHLNYTCGKCWKSLCENCVLEGVACDSCSGKMLLCVNCGDGNPETCVGCGKDVYHVCTYCLVNSNIFNRGFLCNGCIENFGNQLPDALL